MKRAIAALVLLFAAVSVGQELFESRVDSMLHYYSWSDYDDAVLWGIKAIEAFREVHGDTPDTGKLAPVIFFLGNLYDKLHQDTLAEKYYLESLALYRRVLIGPDPAMLTILKALNTLYQRGGQLNKIQQSYDEEVVVLTQLIDSDQSDNWELARRLNEIALYYEQNDAVNKAEAAYVQALHILIKDSLSARIDLATVYSNLGRFYSKQGLYSKAERLLYNALYIRTTSELEDSADLATSYMFIAILLDETNRFSLAQTYYEQALQTYRRIGERYDATRLLALKQTAILNMKTGNYAVAESLFSEVVSAYRALGGNNIFLVSSLQNLANYYSFVGRDSIAETLLAESLTLLNDLDKVDSILLIGFLTNAGSCYGARGKSVEAEKYLKEAYIISSRIPSNNTTSLVCLINFANFLRDWNRNAEADSVFQVIQKIIGAGMIKDSALLFTATINLAIFCLETGKIETAKQLFDESYNHLDHIYGFKKLLFRMIYMGARGLFYAGQNNRTKGISDLIEAFSILLQYINKVTQGFTENEMAIFLEREKMRIEQVYSLAEHDSIRQTSASSIFMNNQLTLKGFLLNNTLKVRRMALSSKDTALTVAYRKMASLRELSAKLSSLTVAEIQQWGYDYDSVVNEANRLEKEVSRAAGITDTRRDSISWQQIRNGLGKDEAAVELIRYRYYDNRWTDTVHYAALIVTRECSRSPLLAILHNGNDLEGKLLRQYRMQMKQTDYVPDSSFYENYWAPVAVHLQGKRRVYVCADGSYNSINLSTLWNGASHRFLGEETEIVNVTSLKDILKPERSNRRKNTATLVGNPDYMLSARQQAELSLAYAPAGEYDRGTDSMERFNPAPLPGTAIEVKHIDSLLRGAGWVTAALLQEAALEEAVKAQQSPRVLHIATHGFFLPDAERAEERWGEVLGMKKERVAKNPLLRSGLLLAGATRYIQDSIRDTKTTDNGVLTAFEAMNLGLDSTELVVLSACETGLGDIKNGEGVYGLQRAFTQAGAEAVLMSLWKVNDKATQEFMELFYREWLKGNSKQGALRAARAGMSARYPSPYYWGAFVLIGK